MDSLNRNLRLIMILDPLPQIIEHLGCQKQVPRQQFAVLYHLRRIGRFVL